MPRSHSHRPPSIDNKGSKTDLLFFFQGPFPFGFQTPNVTFKEIYVYLDPNIPSNTEAQKV